MTPPGASTAAGRQASRPGKASTGHRRSLRKQVAPPRPRRVSGPARSRVGPSVSRRVAFPARAAAFVRTLAEHSLLDRIVRGRAWIPLLGVMLVGIVATQVEVLKLGASIGRSIQRGSALQSRNELLRASVASLADDQRIERLAAGMGMVMPEPAAISFLSAHPADAGRAVSNIHAPASATF